MTLLVLDANVAAKWFLPAKSEPLADEAFTLLGKYAKDEIRFIVPDVCT